MVGARGNTALRQLCGQGKGKCTIEIITLQGTVVRSRGEKNVRTCAGTYTHTRRRWRASESPRALGVTTVKVGIPGRKKNDEKNDHDVDFK